MWDFTGGTPTTSDEFFPSGIMYNGANTHTLSVTVTNGCRTDTDQESFDLLDGLNWTLRCLLILRALVSS
ncbi:MAG: hypothetical protein IPH04_19860 [Saprospirales bacterium]|nr:hypothetical protein [Saprospirales bacterium]